MKRKFAKLGLVSTLAATVLSAVITTGSQNIAPLDAEAYNDKTSLINGLYERVTDINSIEDDEKLLVMADGNKTFQYIVGASYHYWMTTEFSEFTDIFNNGDFVFANNVKGELVTFDKNNDGSFYLKLDHFVDYGTGYGDVKSGYIVHEAYNNNGVTAFGDLFFRTGKDKPSANNARWRVTKDAYNHTTITSLSGRQLHWKQCGGYNWSSFIATDHTEWSSNVELYRKVTDTFGAMITVNNYPTKTTYSIGDDVDLSGLKVTAKLLDEQEITVSYNDKPHLFTDIEFSGVYKAVFFDFCGIRGYFNVTVNNGLQDEHKFLKSNAKIVDPRGTYLLGVQGSIYDKSMQSEVYYPLVLNLLSRSIKTSEGTFTYSFGEIIPIPTLPPSGINPISDLTLTTGSGQGFEYVENDLVVQNRVAIVLEEGNYYLKNLLSSNYLYSNAGTLSSTNSLPVGSNNITIDSNNHILTHNGADIFVVDLTDNLNKVKTVSLNSLSNENYMPLELYKLQLNSNSAMYDEVETKLNNFKTLFYEKTNNYESGVSLSNWADLKSAFNSLYLYIPNPLLDLQGYLASIQYNHNQEKDESFEEMIDIYDTIVFLNNGNLEDFMGRRASGSLLDYRNVTFNLENCSSNGASKAYHGTNYVATLTPKNPLTTQLPASVQILMNGNALRSGTDYTYSEGTITINAGVITEDITINAVGTVFAYRVTYISSTSLDDYVETANINPGTYTLKTYAEVGFPAHPEGKQFKCWLVDSEEVAPNTTITLTGDTTITPVFVNNPAIDELNYRETISSLSYDYEVVSEGVFNITNVVLRFGGLVSKYSWDLLDSTFGGIEGFGVLICTNKLDDLDQLTPSNATYNSYVAVGTEIGEMAHPNVASDSVKAANHIEGENFSKEYYAWNLRVNVSQAHWTSNISAVAYVKTTNGGYIYFGQVTTSVKQQAEEMLLNRGFEDAFDGTLEYLSNL